ncbi:MAG: 50S ribosomal protein L11 methyltransferase [Ruminococcus sp.]|nr:50S ribosomal protein L11 methyltransferase [Ruminococcus sp.]MCM1380996.1 50S ribosomal protein L11 methyltransferase [Muribaculaceae bacterium]MCM1479409.1 50S ribosomal protein L11 methyltransferase [Muribaculaceae bacterium]
MNWTEVNIFTTTEGIDPVCGCLLGIGVTGFVIKDAKDFEEFLADKTGNWDYIDDDLMNLRDCETCVTVYLPDDTQGADMLSALRSEMSALAERDTDKAFGRLAVELANVREEDWANNWKQYFKPLTVGEKLVIKPSWEEYAENDGRTVLEIDPASSFGTGQHNTTQLCLELIEENLRPGDRVLDLGCGSGILSIAAMLLGAKEVTAVDVSQNSVETAKENAAKNRIPAEKYRAYCGDIVGDGALVEKIGEGYDIIAANIVADVLIAMSPLFEKFLKMGGTLILSGIITERCNEVMDAVSAQGYDTRQLKSKDGWAALSFKRGQWEIDG